MAAISNCSMAGKAEWWQHIPGGADREFPDLCGVSGAVGIKGKGGWFDVLLCHPVSIGLTSEEKDGLALQYPTPVSYVEQYGSFLGGLLWAALVVNAIFPLDNTAPGTYGDPTSETDGWAVTPGMTSFAVGTVAGILSFAAMAEPGFLQELQQVPNMKSALLEILQKGCRDVEPFLNCHTAAGEDSLPEYKFPDDGKDLASGAGVLVGWFLLHALSP